MKLSTTIVGAALLLAVIPGSRAQDGCLPEYRQQCADAVAQDHDAPQPDVRPATTWLVAAADAAAPSAAKAAQPVIAERSTPTVRIMYWVFGLAIAVAVAGGIAMRSRRGDDR